MNVIKAIRLQAVMSQAEFARAVGMGPDSICRYENGVRDPSMPTIRKFLDFAKKHKIKVTVEDFMSGDYNEKK